MDNILLGKVVKAMYKLSGKTLVQLADETGLTVDTINNLFYARLQKPGFTGVCALVRAAGFSVTELCGFGELAAALPPDADITAEFTKYLDTVKDTTAFAAAATPVAADTGRKQNPESGEMPQDRIRERYDHGLNELRRVFDEEVARCERETEALRRSNLILSVALAAVALGAVIAVLVK